MRRRGTAGLLIAFFLVTGSLIAIGTILPVNVRAATLYVGGVGPGNFTTIMDALNASNPGDTIFVYSGIYRESIGLDRISLVGEGRDTTVIDANGAGSAVYMGTWANISGFTITNSSVSGIHLYWSSDCRIYDNVITNAGRGIYSNASERITISDNRFIGGGISLDSPYNDELRYWNTHTIDSLNTVNGKPIYFWKDRSGGVVPQDAGAVMLVNVTGVVAANLSIDGGYAGVDMAFSSHVTVRDSNISSNLGQGVYVAFSDNVTVTGNDLEGNRRGIHFHLARDNVVAGNVVQSNDEGIRVDYTYWTELYHNNIVNNLVQSFDYASNQWDDGYPSGGNYWTDYAGIDNCSGPNQDICPDPDSISDTPRRISLNSAAWDRYPLMKPFLPTPSPPSEPRGLQATGGDRLVSLTWNPPVNDGGSPVTNYVVYRGTFPGGETFLVELGDVTSHVDTGLTNGRTYHYKVSAKNALGEGARSSGASATPVTVPGPPLNLSAVAGDGEVTLIWSPPLDDGGSTVTNYRIYMGTSPGGETFHLEVGSVALFTVSGLVNDQTYYFRVSARNTVGEGYRSSEASATPTRGIDPPSAPRILQAFAGDARVTLTWEAPIDDGGSQITNYRIYRRAPSGGQMLIATMGVVFTYFDTGLSNGKTYYYQVSAGNQAGEGPKSNEAGATPIAQPPTNLPPTCNIVSPLPGDTVAGVFRIAGIASDLDGGVQRVEVRIDGGQWTLATGDTSWTYEWNTRLVQNGQHTVHARSFDGANYSTVVSVTVAVDNVTPQPSREESPYQWSFWALLATVVIETALLLFLLWRMGRKPDAGQSPGSSGGDGSRKDM